MVDLPYKGLVGFFLKVLKFTNLKGMIIRVSWLNKLVVKFPAFSRGNSSLPDILVLPLRELRGNLLD